MTRRTREVKWKDVQIGDTMEDGSMVTELHPIHEIECYTIEYGNRIIKNRMVLSADHIILCDISRLEEGIKQEVLQGLEHYKIPKKMDYVIKTDTPISRTEQERISLHLSGKRNIPIKNGLVLPETSSPDRTAEEVLKDCVVEERVVEHDDAVISEKEVWLSIRLVANIVKHGQKLRCNGHRITNCRYSGIKEARCISTDTGKYESKGLIHHNSVAVRNIILHALTHPADMSVALVDLKQTEFTYFKGKEGVVGVANEVQEAAELLRIARDVMYKRNKEMAKLGLTDFVDFKPQHPTDTITISGRDLHEDETVKVRVDNGEIQEMSAKELLDYVNK